MDKLAQAAARRLLDQEASDYVRGLLGADGINLPAGATCRDVLLARLQALAKHNKEAARLARELEEGGSP